MMKKLLLIATLIFTSFAFSQTITITSAPITVAPGSSFQATADFDAQGGPDVSQLRFIVRIYDTNTVPASIVQWRGAGNVNIIPAAQTGTGIVSGSITIPSGDTPSASLPAGQEYRLVVEFTAAGGSNHSVFQVITVQAAAVPTITQSVITTAEMMVDANGKAIGWAPDPTITITLTNFAPNTTYRVFNQFKITDTNGAQWGGGFIDILTDGTGFGENTVWNPGFFGSDGDFNGSETVAFWNSNTTGPSGAVATNQTFPITNTTLSTPKVEALKAATFYPNPTNGIVNIKGAGIDIKSVEVYNVVGALVSKTTDFTNLISGVYFLKLNTEGGSVTKRVIKQ
ncbi:hypothetical protein GCM10023314_03690 [Algibacter agarivorans]|uniref:Secretion system C-terminal sorting domain-containing protein n=1 Tax=Algibacter agarivorans TaxID=1109741 RepID=A0ABP9GAC4_9FLAO